MSLESSRVLVLRRLNDRAEELRLALSELGAGRYSSEWTKVQRRRLAAKLRNVERSITQCVQPRLGNL